MLLKYIHLLSISLWLGGMFFFSLIVAPAIFRTLSRQDAGTVVGLIFPKYWILGYISSTVLLVTLYLIAKGDIEAVKTPMIILGVVTALAFTSGLVIGSKARVVKEEMRAEATPEPLKIELRKKFGKLHAISSVINVAILILNLVYLWYLPAILKL